VLLYLYLRERLPDPSRPARARLLRVGLATTFAIFNFPWVLVAGRALSGSMWGVGRIPYLGPLDRLAAARVDLWGGGWRRT